MRYLLVLVLVVSVVDLVGRAQDELSATPATPSEQLLVACKNPETTPEQIDALLQAGADINTQDQDGWTPLMLTAQHGTDHQVMKLLLDAGADPKIKNKLGHNALHYARENQALKDSSLFAICKDPNSTIEKIRGRLQVGADVNARDQAGTSPMMWAARHSENPDVVLLLLEAGADINVRDGDGSSAMMWAALYNKNPEITKVLLAEGADVKAKNNLGWTPLLCAAHSENPEIIQALLEVGADVNGKDVNDQTALIHALKLKSGSDFSLLMGGGVTLWLPQATTFNPKAISHLLEAGADVHAKDKFGHTALWYAMQTEAEDPHQVARLINNWRISLQELQGIEQLIKEMELTEDPRLRDLRLLDRKWGLQMMLAQRVADLNQVASVAILPPRKENPDVIRALLEAGADVNVKGEDGRSFLWYAMERNSGPEVISAMIRAGAHVNAKGGDGKNALWYALETTNDPEVILLLLDAGADVNARNDDWNTPIMWAASNQNARVISAMIQAGAQVNSRGLGRQHALIWASRYNDNPDVVPLLLEAGADVHAKDKSGWTSLMYAASRDNLSMIGLLLDAGAQVNAQDQDGLTPLMCAVRSNQTSDTSERLLLAGASVNMSDRVGRTPLIHALQVNANPELITVLLTAGADVNVKDQVGRTPLMYAVSRSANKVTDLLKGRIQWTRADGGNGHCYQIMEFDSWHHALAEAKHFGGYLASITSPQENEFVVEKLIGPNRSGAGDVILGGLCKRPDRWLWLSGEAFHYANWAQGQPSPGNEYHIAIYGYSVAPSRGGPSSVAPSRGAPSRGGSFTLDGGGTWNNVSAGRNRYLVEWDDCPVLTDDAMLDAEPGVDALNLLLQAGADINTQDKDGWTPLMLTAQHATEPQVMKRLLDAGADPTITNKLGHNALHYARENTDLNGTKAYWQLNDATYGQ